MSYKLTFNRPAVRQFIEGAEHQGLRIRVNDGMVQFMPSETIDSGTANLEPRTRGGFESVIEGNEADNILKSLRNPHGPFFILKRVDKDWVQAEPWTGKGDPPKFEPHVRVWHASQPKPKAKSPAASKRTTSTVKVIADQPVDIAERVRWAYSRVGEDRRPGRPSREYMEARAVVQSFETAALEFMSNLSTKQVDLRAIVGAYHQITEFLREAAPEALHGDMPLKARRKSRVQKVEDNSDDDRAAEANREAEHMLGLDKKSEPVSRRVRGKVHSRAFGGESLVA